MQTSAVSRTFSLAATPDPTHRFSENHCWCLSIPTSPRSQIFTGEPVSFPISKQSSLSENMKYFPKAKTECGVTQVLWPLMAGTPPGPWRCRWGGRGCGGCLLASPSHVTSRGLVPPLDGDQLHSPAPRIPGPLLLSLQSNLPARAAGTGPRKSWGGTCPQSQRPGCGAERLHSWTWRCPPPGRTKSWNSDRRGFWGRRLWTHGKPRPTSCPEATWGPRAGACRPHPSPTTLRGPPAEWGAAPSRVLLSEAPQVGRKAHWLPGSTSRALPPLQVGAQGRGDLSPPLRHFPTSWPPEFLPGRPPPLSPAGAVGARRGLGS